MVTFGENTLKEFLDAAKQISDKQKNDKNVLGILLDLRNNPGGYLDTAIDINGFFFTEDKTAVILQDNNGNEEVYQSKYQGKDKEYLTGSGLLAPFKVIILINKGSASSSEILAGSLQDYGKAKLVGEQSFGKGTVQELTQYKDNSVFKLTISKWLTPRKRDINKKGLVADIFVSNTGKDDTQLNTAINEF
jgi:carboxyl-terminal processing protease